MKKDAREFVQARRFLVKGRVQGVGFRWFVIDEAERLGLAGWTRNLANGSVEVLAQGEPDSIESLAGLLRQGPASARVDTVLRGEAEVEAGLKGFRVRH